LLAFVLCTVSRLRCQKIDIGDEHGYVVYILTDYSLPVLIKQLVTCGSGLGLTRESLCFKI